MIPDLTDIKDLHYYFAVVVEESGRKRPAIFIGNKKYLALELIAGGHLYEPDMVELEVNRIREVIEGNKREYLFGSQDFCVFLVKWDKTRYDDNLEQHESFYIKTSVLLELLTHWHKFLDSYQSNKIPGLTYSQ